VLSAGYRVLRVKFTMDEVFEMNRVLKYGDDKGGLGSPRIKYTYISEVVYQMKWLAGLWG